jgi:ABC-type uncharacterized transport system substrate-binding protein
VLCVFVLFWIGRPAIAGEIVIIPSSDAEPYAQAEAAARTALAAQRHALRTVKLKDAEAKGAALAGGDVDGVLAIGTSAAQWAAKQLPADTPLVCCMVNASMADALARRPASYAVTIDVPLAAQFKLIEQALPKARTLGILYRANSPDGAHQLQAITEALPKDWHLEAIAIDQHPSVAAAIDALMRRHVHVIWTAPDSSIYDNATIRALLLAAIRAKTPVFGFSPAFVRAGALVGVGVDPAAQGLQSAQLSHLVARGSPAPKPAGQALRPPDQFQIAVNTQVADQLGAELPAELVKRANYVFKADR